MPEILLATKSEGKLRELREMTAASGIIWRGLIDFPGAADALEDGETFLENARKKALHYAGATGLHALADDSGLEVDALDGSPGVHSAYYAGHPRDDGANNDKLLAALRDVPDERRSARFRCVMVFARPGAALFDATGAIEGRIVREPRGANGFGYDPLFVPAGRPYTMAELSSGEKNAISHRGRALRAMLEKIHAYYADGR